MVGILGYQHMCQKSWPRQSSVNRPGWRGMLHNHIAAGATEFGTHRLQDFEVSRNIFQHLGNVLAQPVQFAPAVRAATHRRFQDLHFTRQLFGQRFAVSLTRGGCRSFSWSLGRSFGLTTNLQIFQLQLELFDLAVQTFGTPPKLHPLQFRNQQLQAFDFILMGIQLRLLFVHQLMLPNHQGVLFDHQQLQCHPIETIQIWQFNISNHRGCINRMKNGQLRSQIPEVLLVFYTNDSGDAVRTGRRQSMPSNSIDNCARLNETEPDSAFGQMNRPRSRRLAKRQRPSPSHHNSLIRSPRRPRNTNTCPEQGLSVSTVWTIALSPVKPRRMSVTPAAIQILFPASGTTRTGTKALDGSADSLNQPSRYWRRH